ncbi:uncharacterized protein MONOS_4024 [Monocercomonoides exilis]|uniref:uncharacterized protein n=1 Tax=Monocercomonoides exilis TaxID=2049356 RepID=UPI00355AB8F9|nr:hypothetical protein MONOS_4024 [Monocercomonoides exilis]|eukprot:MONOS_4024.1-p1 / transcript=MONOS_4024.1 / gene=MONOS_4024 / organism=Monocercomonoides_exilis_PA203 / gene_product=unspecified product / transcript_product=unspecified product / location=Mono_scaffold00102:838-8919(-) / protein_length=2693 / sequence_SO=supercontig / SO=protein_coding / is_pseudo=false
MQSCLFSSVCDAYDGGILPSLSKSLTSLAASNTSFIGCCRTRNVEHIGTEEEKKHPGRMNETDNGANTFTWCEWIGSNTTGTDLVIEDGQSCGGAICMYGRPNGELFVSHCKFNDCTAHYDGGGILCASVKSFKIENNTFNSCSTEVNVGGAICALSITACVRIRGCEFEKCKAKTHGGGLYLENFLILGTGCIEAEDGEGKSACVFDCSFSSCSIDSKWGGGMNCRNVPVQFKMRSIQFISCKASSYGGGLHLSPNQSSSQSDSYYCYFLFFHECKCSANPPYGHDVMYYDRYNFYLSSNNPFYECYTTNTNDTRVCYAYNYSNASDWTYDQTTKKDWLKRGIVNRFVAVSGGNEEDLCGIDESSACRTIGVAVSRSVMQLSLSVTLMEGNYASEATTIEIGSKKISVIGKGREESSIGTGALSAPSSSGALFSMTEGYLRMKYLNVDCNSTADSSPSVVVVSDGSGTLSLEDVVITTSVSSGNVISSSVFVVSLSQLSMVDVEIINMNVSKPLFSEPDLPSFSLSSSSLFSAGAESTGSILVNMNVKNVKLTNGDGVAVAKSVKEGETFVVKNVTIEDCECEDGSGSGIKIDLSSSSSKLRAGTSSTPEGEATKFNRCKCSGYGGGIMLHLDENSFDFSICSVNFEGCTAKSGGNYLFVNGSELAIGTISTANLNIQRNTIAFNELVGFDRSDPTLGLFPLNVYLDEIDGSAHVGKEKENGLGGCNSLFCGLDYYPCATITHAAKVRYPEANKNIELDSGFELAEEVAMIGEYEWKVFCITKGMKVIVKTPDNLESEFLIEVQSACKMENISFSLQTDLEGVTSLISANSTLLTLTDCSVCCSSENAEGDAIGYSFIRAIGRKLKMEGFVIEESLMFGVHSLVEFASGVDAVVCMGCNVSNIEKRNEDGGWMDGEVGAERGEGKNGIIVIEGCNIKGCSCCGRGGGIHASVKGEGSVVVNGMSVIDGCEANGLGEREGRGGGMMVEMGSRDCGLKIESGVKFSVDADNAAMFGKDVFVCCNSGILLESKVNATSFGFFDARAIPTDVLELSGSENGNEDEVIPLFVYLCSMGSKLIVDGSGEWSLDHSRCGFEKFGCLTIDYCISERANISIHIIEVVSESSIKSEVKVASSDVCLSGKIESVEEEKMRVEVSDEGSANQERFIECTSSLSVSYITFSVDSPLKNARKALIYSSLSTLTIANCSISFAEEALTSGMIGYSIIDIKGGELIVDVFVMEEKVKIVMNGISPITMKNGTELDIKNISVSGVEVAGGSGGGCLNVEIKEGGNANIEGCNLSSRCSGGSGMKGGGVMISVGERGSLEIKNVKFDGCEVPSTDKEEGGRGIGGGTFVRFAEEMGSTVLEGMIFEGCNAWKGKNVFVSGWDLREIMPNEQLKWEITEEKLDLLDELCGWERKTTGEGYVIPLVVYLWSNWSGDGFVSKEKGGDFSGCGFSEAPCSSIDHLVSLRYATLETEESKIIVSDSGLLRSSILFSSSSLSLNTPVVKIEGEINGTVLRIEEEKETDGENGEAMVASEVILSFVNISFSLPNVLVHHLSFLKSSSTNGTLSVKSCSFVCEDPSKETDFCLVKVDGGSVAIEDCALKEFHFSQGFVELSSDVKVADVMNLSITNTSISGRSLISLSESALSSASLLKGTTMLRGKENGDGVMLLSINSSSFTSITCNDSRAAILNGDSSDCGMKCCVEKCVMTKCLSEKSEEGGGMKVSLRGGGSELKVSGCSFGMCICSIVKGRGGGLMIDASGLGETEAGTEDAPPLGIMIESTRFAMNDAFVGKDVFIRCKWIEKQINEKLFSLDFSQDALKSNNSICGNDEEKRDIDLIPLITFYYGQQVFVEANGRDMRQCGEQMNPCKSISHGVSHIQKGIMNAIFIDGEGDIGGECVMGDVSVKPMKKVKATIRFNEAIQEMGNEGNMIMFVNECVVERCVFEFGEQFSSSHSCIMKVKNGTTEMRECECLSSTFVLTIHSTIMGVEGGELEMVKCVFTRMKLSVPLIEFIGESKAAISETKIDNLDSEGNVIEVGDRADVEMKELDVQNITLSRSGSVVKMQNLVKNEVLSNCSFGKCLSSKEKGSIVSVSNCANVRFDLCRFSGDLEEEAREERKTNGRTEEVCKWKGSVVDAISSSLTMKDTTISNSKKGGLSLSGGSVVIEKGEFENNNPSIEGYPSLRRNIICSDSGTLNVVSVKGGDGIEKNTSLWILDEGCKLGGIAAESASPFFIPVLEDVQNATKPSGELKLIIHGKLLLPCNLSVKINMKDGDVELVETQKIEEGWFVSENEVHSRISLELLKVMEKKTEVSVWMVFGKDETCFSNGIVVISKSESQSKGDENENEGGGNINKGGTRKEWSLIVIVVMGVLFVISMLIFVAVVVLLRKKLKEAEKRVSKERLENEQIMGKPERRRRENNGGSFEVSEIPSTLLEGMTSQIPLLIDNDEDLPEPPSMNEGILNENDLPDLESSLPFSEDDSAAGAPKSHSFNVISAKKPFREKEKKNIKTLYSMIHSVQGNFTLGTRAMDVVDGKEVVLAVAELFEHLISVEDERTEMMARQLCPYSIFVEEGTNEIFVLTEELEDEKQKDEMKRWKAPEEEDEEIEKAVVFTLGLILHEMTTGEVPLSECNAEEAQEMIRDGVRPLTEGIEGEELIEVMEKMWADEPNDRPSLAEVKKSIKKIMMDEG